MSYNKPSGLSISDSRGPKPSDSGVSRVEIFNLLSNERRVYALEYLDENCGESTFADIVEAVAARQYGHDTDEISSSERNRVSSSLSQTHIPTLKSEGVINYDRKTGTISLTEHASAVIEYLRPASPLKRVWQSLTAALPA